MNEERKDFQEAGAELRRVRKTRGLVELAESHHLREAMEVQARTIYGCDLWSLDLVAAEDLEAQLKTMVEFLEQQRDVARSVH